MAFVYILQSLRDDRYYIGSTSNLNQRLEHHLGGSTPSTKRFGGVKLVLSQEYQSLTEARLIERRLKKFKRKDFIDKIVKDGFIKLKARSGVAQR